MRNARKPGLRQFPFSYTPLDDPSKVYLIEEAMAENENPYWSLNKICVMELSFEGVGPGWLICEVDSADCELESGGRCASDCGMAEGLTFLLPDGLQLAGS